MKESLLNAGWVDTTLLLGGWAVILAVGLRRQSTDQRKLLRVWIGWLGVCTGLTGLGAAASEPNRWVGVVGAVVSSASLAWALAATGTAAPGSQRWRRFAAMGGLFALLLAAECGLQWAIRGSSAAPWFAVFR